MTEQFTRTSITLPRDLKRKARVKAAQEETNLSEVIRNLLTQWTAGEEQQCSQETEDNG